MTMVDENFIIDDGVGDPEEYKTCAWEGAGGSIDCSGGDCVLLIGDNDQSVCIECIGGPPGEPNRLCRENTIKID